ncbi:cyclin-dependent kinase inhibitor 5-like [Zingiber officinale]|uniref:Cyclin-dependent kinase inhibitor n=1 Tax=Zingiber officinale TaxID=94328 RepID=A0A8J5GM65_ZINOF|nr:cyclin-dependent kinase inhibitor 5-like [Zingiber officinale]KAG6503698.1 hypothetical protein ZIOFF_036022 [Zingiber officinale]
MGRYMRKDKQSGEVAIVEVSTHQPSLGVRTRSRALAAAAEQDSPLAYLELRSRRLEKPLAAPHASKVKETVPKTSPASITNPRIGGQKSGTSSSGPAVGTARGPRRFCSDKGSPDVEDSCDENVLELDLGERGVVPCSLIRDVGTIGTPGSTTNSTYYSITSKQRKQSAISQYIPSNQEMEEFFVGLEKPQHEKFIKKYNFDPVNDCPLPGRYEWEKLNSW